ncbi:unnamed protein product [Protopolystoma xenopodis]|uniref:Uncharacterized protein n=1 Tax=Protopolystoma xenopodis TaxID=117903 RepID=A0A3S5B615_9PLAT|nr:unnamed protein product [Protopolystoma xenopodis]
MGEVYSKPENSGTYNQQTQVPDPSQSNRTRPASNAVNTTNINTDASHQSSAENFARLSKGQSHVQHNPHTSNASLRQPIVSPQTSTPPPARLSRTPDPTIHGLTEDMLAAVQLCGQLTFAAYQQQQRSSSLVTPLANTMPSYPPSTSYPQQLNKIQMSSLAPGGSLRMQTPSTGPVGIEASSAGTNAHHSRLGSNSALISNNSGLGSAGTHLSSSGQLSQGRQPQTTQSQFSPAFSRSPVGLIASSGSGPHHPHVTQHSSSTGPEVSAPSATSVVAAAVQHFVAAQQQQQLLPSSSSLQAQSSSTSIPTNVTWPQLQTCTRRTQPLCQPISSLASKRPRVAGATVTPASSSTPSTNSCVAVSSTPASCAGALSGFSSLAASGPAGAGSLLTLGGTGVSLYPSQSSAGSGPAPVSYFPLFTCASSPSPSRQLSAIAPVTVGNTNLSVVPTSSSGYPQALPQAIGVMPSLLMSGGPQQFQRQQHQLHPQPRLATIGSPSSSLNLSGANAAITVQLLQQQQQNLVVIHFLGLNNISYVSID